MKDWCVTAGSVLVLLCLGASTASAASPRQGGAAKVAPKEHAAATEKAAPPTTVAPVVIESSARDAGKLDVGKPAPPAAASTSKDKAPSLTEVVRRIEQILREGAPGQARTAAAGGSRSGVRKAGAARAPVPPARERSTAADVVLSWAPPAPPSSLGLQIQWPADLDPRRQPTRPLGVRLSWPTGDAPR